MNDQERLHLEEQVRLAGGVAEVLHNEYLRAADQAIKWDQIVAFARADAGDVEAVMLAKRRYDAAVWHRQKLTNLAERGKFAKAKLEEEEAKE